MSYRIEKAFLDALSRCGPDAKFGSLRTVALTIRQPARRFRGLNRANQEQSFAILSRPDRRYFGPGEREYGPPGDGMGFFVYCSNDLVIHDWDWVDFLKECPAAEPNTSPDAVVSPELAENRYCAQAFELEIPPPQTP